MRASRPSPTVLTRLICALIAAWALLGAPSVQAVGVFGEAGLGLGWCAPTGQGEAPLAARQALASIYQAAAAGAGDDGGQASRHCAGCTLAVSALISGGGVLLSPSEYWEKRAPSGPLRVLAHVATPPLGGRAPPA